MEPASVTPAAQRFACPTCGAERHFDAASGALACGHCGARGILSHEGLPTVVEHPLTHEAVARAARGLDFASVTIRCEECGASLALEPTMTTASCAFCGSSHVLREAPDPSTLRPESLLPFSVPVDVARDRFATWLRKLWFRPSKLSRDAAVSELRGVYVPFFTYDTVSDARWRAERGHHYYVTETYLAEENGKTVQRTRQVQHTRWESASGARRDAFDDLLVCASKGVPPELVDRVARFDTSELTPYRAEYLAGWAAERHAIGLEDGWSTAESRARDQQRTRCANDVGGDTHRNLVVDHAFRDTTWKHVLLPLWIAAYRFDGKAYRFLVNGRTGEIEGKAPYSVPKIASAVVFAILLVGGLLSLLSNGTN